jgi:hypothetical protein
MAAPALAAAWATAPGPVLRPAPTREPPFDDERPSRHLALVGPLDQPLPFEAQGWDRPSDFRLTTVSDTFASRPTARSELPEARSVAHRVVLGIIEAATGRRPATQLAPYTAAAVQAGLVRDAGRITRLGTARQPARVHSLHLTEPADGVAEVAAVIRVGERYRAIALRLEGLDGRWRCVRVQIG